MKNVTPVRILALLGIALAFPALAHAHTGHSLVVDCASGLAHPLHGWDHLAAMLAVGVWAAQLGGRARWLVPSAFVTVMACAAALGTRGVSLPGAEPIIATSVLVFGLLIATAANWPIAGALPIVALFAIAHGFAHGAEIPARANALPYVTGFVAATAALHAVGLLGGQLAARASHHAARALGATCAAVGLALLAA